MNGLLVLDPTPVGSTVPVTVSFADVLAAGETITTPNVNLYIYSGTDANPNANNLFSIITNTNTTVTQHFRPKDPDSSGNIYTTVWQAATNLGNVYEKRGLWAIPPLNDVAPTPPAAGGLFDTGVINSAVGATPVLNATSNALGGLWNVNIYVNIIAGAVAGTISFIVTWFDRASGLQVTRIGIQPSAVTTGVTSTTFPIDTVVGTQVLFTCQFNAVTVGALSYRAECSVTRP